MSKKVIRAGYLKIVKFELSRNPEVTKITVNGNEENDWFLRSKIKTEAPGSQGVAISVFYLKSSQHCRYRGFCLDGRSTRCDVFKFFVLCRAGMARLNEASRFGENLKFL